MIFSVIDRSGSMAGSLLKLVKSAVKFVMNNLKSNDYVSVLTFDNNVDVTFPFTQMNDAGKERCSDLVDSISVGGATNLAGGLFRGLQEMRKRPAEEGRVSKKKLHEIFCGVFVLFAFQAAKVSKFN